MSRKPTLAAFALALCALCGSLSAQETYTVLSAGAISCGVFLRDNERAQSSDLFWVEGFLTGANSFSKAPHAGKNTDYVGRKVWLQNYCQKHPLEHLVDASRALRSELIDDGN